MRRVFAAFALLRTARLCEFARPAFEKPPIFKGFSGSLFSLFIFLKNEKREIALVSLLQFTIGAGEGNRTLVSALGRPHSTIEPHPPSRRSAAAARPDRKEPAVFYQIAARLATGLRY